MSERFAGIPAFHLPYTLPSSVGCNSFVCRSLVLSEAEGYENTGVWGYSSHFGTRTRWDHGRGLPVLRFQLSIEDLDSIGTLIRTSLPCRDYGQNLQSSTGTSYRSCPRPCKYSRGMF